MIHRIGAVMYVIWGVLHVNAALNVYKLGQTLDPGMVQGRVFQGAWNLLIFAIVAIVVAAWLNWRNSRLGYWINLIAITATDIGFIVFVLMPAFVPLWPGLLGPTFWVLGGTFATLGILKEQSTT
jgi:hypothetical protein